jgi:hypothetical protein
MEWWAMVNAKDQQLYAKDQQMYAKDQQLKEMYDRLQSMAERSRLELTELHKADSRSVWLQTQLVNANDEVLELKGRRNVRGAVEYVAKSLTGCQVDDGIATRLMTLQYDGRFVTTLRAHADRLNVELPRALDCMRSIYDRMCQDMHGSEETVYLRYADITAPAQRAVLHAIFDYGAIKYRVVDERGNVLADDRAPGQKMLAPAAAAAAAAAAAGADDCAR